MQNYGKWIGAGAIALAALSTIAGCTDKNNNGQPDSPATTEQIDKTASNMANAASNHVEGAVNAVSNDATKTGKAIEGAADAAVNTPKIKLALVNNPSLAGSNIDVDTNGEKNTINLKGTVKNAAQKTLAASIAQKMAGAQYKISNQLTVAGGKSGMMNKKPATINK